MQEPLTYQEMLRTLGTLLDEADGETGIVAVDRTAAWVLSPVWPRDRRWSMAALARLSAEQRDRRAQPSTPPLRQVALRHKLRTIGALLDRQGYPSYVIVVQPTGVQIESPEGRELTIGSRTLDLLAAAAGARRDRPRADD